MMDEQEKIPVGEPAEDVSELDVQEIIDSVLAAAPAAVAAQEEQDAQQAYAQQPYGQPEYPQQPYPLQVPYDPAYMQQPYYPQQPMYEQPMYTPEQAEAALQAQEAMQNAPLPEPVPERKFAFKVRNLSKDYGGNRVLDDVSFDIPAGAIVGLLGPNGSGKTTLIKILAGLLHDHTGSIKINGKTPGPSTKATIALLPDSVYFPARFRTIDCIKYFADFFKDFNKVKAIEFAAQFGLDLNQRIKTMSKGMQDKLQLLLVMSRAADIYLLDEPLGGVDPAARAVIMDIIINNYKQNATLIISTHLVNDLEHSFDHVLMLGKGKVLVNTGIQTLRSTGKTVEEIFKEVIGDAWEVD